MCRVKEIALLVAASLGACWVGHQNEVEPATALREEMRRLLAVEHDGEFIKEVEASLKKLGVRLPIMFGGSVPVGSGWILTWANADDGTVQLRNGGLLDESREVVLHLPFVVFVTSSGISETAPPTGQLTTAVGLVGYGSGRIGILHFQDATVTVVGPPDEW
jgi:hypothetical protein